MKTVFIKVDASKELPKKWGEYHTNMGLLGYKTITNSWAKTDWCWTYKGGGFFIENEQIKYWLKEVPFSELLPSEEEIEKAADEYEKEASFGAWDGTYRNDDFVRGVEWLIQKLTAK